MNFYKHHIGDYSSHTRELTWAQDLAYRRMLECYYLHEKGLPSDMAKLYRMVGAVGQKQRQAVQHTVHQYFYLEDGLYKNKRAEEEIQQYQAQCEANRRTTQRRIVQRIANESSTNRQPNQNQNQNQIPEPVNPTTSSVVLNTLPEEQKQAAPLENDSQPKGNGKNKPKITKHGYWAAELIKLNVKVTSMHPTLLALIEEGFELPAVIEALSVARQRKPFPEPIGIGYLDAIIRNPPKASVRAWYTSESATLAKGKELGLDPRPGEEMDQYRDRLRTASSSEILTTAAKQSSVPRYPPDQHDD